MATIKKAQNGAKADSLMNESNSKKAFANQQEKFGKAAIKSGNGDKTRLLDLKGTTSPTGQGRIDIAKKARKEATKDSIASIKARKMKNGGSLTGLKGSAKRVGPVDPKGAYTTVQKKTLAGAKGKASLTKDKQLGATKMMAKCGTKMSKK